MIKKGRKEFEGFLESVNLDYYREKYRPIKIVEMDLHKEIQAIGLLYKTYWDERNLLEFRKFYERYVDEKRILLENFRNKT